MPYNKEEVERIVNQFAGGMAASVGRSGAVLARIRGDGSDRSFAVERNNHEIPFLAKLSQSEQGFWGIPYARSEELAQAREHLVLLTGHNRGYFIRKERVKFYLGKASRGHDGIKINEHILRHVPYFSSTDSLWEMLSEADGFSVA